MTMDTNIETQYRIHLIMDMEEANWLMKEKFQKYIKTILGRLE